jgi:hypothetical protein
MIQFMKWQEMKQDTEKHSLVCLRDTSENNFITGILKGRAEIIGSPLFYSLIILSRNL